MYCIPPNPLTIRRSYTAEYRENIAGILRKGVIKRSQWMYRQYWKLKRLHKLDLAYHGLGGLIGTALYL